MESTKSLKKVLFFGVRGGLFEERKKKMFICTVIVYVFFSVWKKNIRGTRRSQSNKTKKGEETMSKGKKGGWMSDEKGQDKRKKKGEATWESIMKKRGRVWRDCRKKRAEKVDEDFNKKGKEQIGKSGVEKTSQKMMNDESGMMWNAKEGSNRMIQKGKR